MKLNGKILKCLLLSVSALLITGILASCKSMFVTGDNNPSVALREFCGYISDGDYKAAFDFARCSTDVSPSDPADTVEEALFTRTMESVSIRPASEPEVKGVSAWQTVEITHLDLRLAVRKLLSGVMEETGAYEWEHGSYRTDEEILQAVSESLIRQLDGELDDCMITETVRLKYRYRDGRWSPVMTKELYNALTGYASEAEGIADEFYNDYHPDTTRNDARNKSD